MNSIINIVEIKHLKKYYKEVKAVDDISFKIKQGELFAFLGVNGAGKTTTIHIICGILKKDFGEVFIHGFNIDKDLDIIKPLLGIVFQNSVLDAKLSVIDNLRNKAYLYGIDKETVNQRIDYFAKKLDFIDILHRPIDKLSGGQKRRVDVARALMHLPKILILDEPTTGLDPKSRILVWKLINDLRKELKMTVLLTTHYMEEANEANYVVMMDNGKIVCEGTPQELKRQYANDFIYIYKYQKPLKHISCDDFYKYIETQEQIPI